MLFRSITQSIPQTTSEDDRERGKTEKRYVPVVVRFDAEGQLRPLEIEFDEAHKYAVDQVLDDAAPPVRR